MTGTLVQVNVSPGGMPKLPVLHARVTFAGVEGDLRRNRKYHGGRDRAVCLYSEELYADLTAEGVDLHAGQIGENFTTRGLDLCVLVKGDRLRVGECVVELTEVRTPCRSLDQWDKRLMKMLRGRSGWKAKVVREGWVRPGDAVEVLTVDRVGSASNSA